MNICAPAQADTDRAFERWRPAPGYEGLYDVSSLGRIRRSHGAPKSPATKPGRIRATSISSMTGYPQLTLYRPGHKPTWVTVHSLVCEAFHGPKPTPHHEAGHLNGNRQDCRAENLAWLTRSENRAQSYRDGRKTSGAAGRPGAGNCAARLTEDDVRAIRRDYEPGNRRHTPGNSHELADKYGVTTATIVLAATRRTWKNLDQTAAT